MATANKQLWLVAGYFRDLHKTQIANREKYRYKNNTLEAKIKHFLKKTVTSFTRICDRCQGL